uniref:Dicer like-protein 2 n=1 Tax=Colletotrichum lindemuthianum TaxID=290576 RepID=A0A0P0IBT6_COLLN|nr:dicer like-protein 2 [Colletotrichum lindemuthianum]ALJ83741.1 dicer like-protein 2 [Colletotrichum lindemuthianum]
MSTSFLPSPSDGSEASGNDAGSDVAFGVQNQESRPNPEEEDELFLDNEACAAEDSSSTPVIMNSRAYQVEMFNESMKQNIIVAMDTGSGKTHVAILRIMAEIDRTPLDRVSISIDLSSLGADSGQIVWFLAPTVSLCAQQFTVLKTQIPTVQIKFLSGDDNVDSWSDQSIWDSVLSNVRIVVSTYQILLDALSHAFVPLQRLSLIVFDEAHNCIGKSPGSRIMNNFYHHYKRKGEQVPHILGLTASPSFGSRPEGIANLEATLDAVCKSPTMHRDDLLACVKKPELAYVPYLAETALTIPSSLRSLRKAVQTLDVTEDPYVLHLQAEGTDRSKRELESVLVNHDTYVHNQMTAFCRQAQVLCRELGSWATEYYIWHVVTRFKNAVRSRSVLLDNWQEEEKRYLENILERVELHCPSVESLTRMTMSDKISVLIDQLLQEETNIIGIVFARERATVAVLSQLLMSHQTVRQKYRIGGMVGTSQFQARKKDIHELTQAEDMQSLQQFKSGKIDLLVATSVLEEGIDVPACNLVLCFDIPPNLKSFIQRRGRARMRDSKLIMLFDRIEHLPKDWEEMEVQMKQQYEEQERELQHLQEVEETEEFKEMRFEVKSTGALLDLDNARAHLDHLCRILSPGEYIDWRPDYILRALDTTSKPDLKVKVMLPSFLPAHVRCAESKTTWKTEKMAIKDAAFQAYVALYNAGLVNDNLLPFKMEDFVPGVDKRVGILQVNGLLNAWTKVAIAWKRGHDTLRAARLRLRDSQGVIRGDYEMVMPISVPGLTTMPIYLDHDNCWSLEFGPQVPIEHDETEDQTAVLLALPYRHRWSSADLQQVVSFRAVGAHLSLDQLAAKDFVPGEMSDHDLECFIRDESGCPFLYKGVIPNKPPSEMVQKPFYGFDKAPDDVPYLTLTRWSRRTDFLHRPQSDAGPGPNITKPYSRVYPVPMAKVDTIPSSYAQFGVLIPSIIHRIETCLVAKELSQTILRPLCITDPSLVLTSICTGSASEPTNHERLEFLGDSILKFSATINVAALKPDWPERFLSFKKDSIVANSTLCKAAVKHGLDRFILAKPFTGMKWRPIYVDDVLQGGNDMPTRKLSSKTLADIVEALIGASTVDGGLPKALDCITIFLQQIEWRSIDRCRQVLFDVAPVGVQLPSTLEPLERLIGYRFNKKSLLVQSMNHASSNIGNSVGSLERLEFIGDSILDNIIVTRLFKIQPPLSHQTMHLLKTAMVNGDFLGFLALENAVDQDEIIISSDNKDIDIQHSRFRLPLWKFMRHQSAAIGIEQLSTEKRHAAMRQSVVDAMVRGKTYPWALLARLQLRKFYSDIFESLLGAVWVDSGSMDVCTQVIARFGILGYLDRILRDGVHALHPKEELGHLADTERVQYAVSTREDGGGSKEFLCKVTVGQRCVVEVDGGVARDEVMVKAAEAAVSILKAEKMMQNGVRDEGGDVMDTK